MRKLILVGILAVVSYAALAAFESTEAALAAATSAVHTRAALADSFK